MRKVISKTKINSLYSGIFNIYKYIVYMNVRNTKFEFIHKYETFEEYSDLLKFIITNNINLDDITEFKEINKEEIKKDLKRYEYESKFR